MSLDIKNFLMGIRRNRQRIAALRARLAECEDMASSLGSLPASRRSGRSQASRTEHAAIRLALLTEDLERQINQLITQNQLAERLINTLPDPRHQDVLRYRYLNGWRWEKVAEAMGYDLRWVLRLHGEALDGCGKG